MGASASKPTEGTVQDLSEGSIPSTPILTPQIRKLELDPRSPSTDILRTPIEVLRTPSPNAVHNKKGCTIVDPRSPTTEFHRTPIVINAATSETPTLTIHNKILDNVRQPLMTMTPLKSNTSTKINRKINHNSDVSEIVPPKLLESNPITSPLIKQTENKRNSVVGLLETNIDFVETDLDVVIQNKIIEAETELTSDTHEFNNDILETCPQYSVDETDEPELLINTISDLNISKIQIEEFDRKLSNLIYEDKQTEESPKVARSVVNHRTPLGDRNSNNQKQSKSIPVLKVSDKPSKFLSGGISKIPVFKEKKGKAKVNVQCENTPPRMRPKQSRWSAEDSLVI